MDFSLKSFSLLLNGEYPKWINNESKYTLQSRSDKIVVIFVTSKRSHEISLKIYFNIFSDLC